LPWGFGIPLGVSLGLVAPWEVVQEPPWKREVWDLAQFSRAPRGAPFYLRTEPKGGEPLQFPNPGV